MTISSLNKILASRFVTMATERLHTPSEHKLPLILHSIRLTWTHRGLRCYCSWLSAVFLENNANDFKKKHSVSMVTDYYCIMESLFADCRWQTDTSWEAWCSYQIMRICREAAGTSGGYYRRVFSVFSPLWRRFNGGVCTDVWETGTRRL